MAHEDKKHMERSARMRLQFPFHRSTELHGHGHGSQSRLPHPLVKIISLPGPWHVLMLSSLVLLVPVSATRSNETKENSIAMRLVRIPAGEFTMGSPPTEKGRRPDEPQRRVRLTQAYDLGQFEVTHGQFRQFVDATGYKTDAERGIRGGYGFDEATQQLAGPDHRYSWRFTGFAQTDDHPVVNVSWNDANAFCRWLSDQEKATYRLPSEAEWEHACRGGTTTAYCYGDDPEKIIDAGNIMDSLAHEKFADRITVAGSDGFVFTAPVGRFRPNAFGLHDMHGNVWEWTADGFGPPDSTPQTDPAGPVGGKDKVVRGGDWYHDWSFARSAQRYPIYPSLCRRHAGFRVVREIPPVRPR
jgi:sulfatase modifying factor 1